MYKFSSTNIEQKYSSLQQSSKSNDNNNNYDDNNNNNKDNKFCILPKLQYSAYFLVWGKIVFI